MLHMQSTSASVLQRSHLCQSRIPGASNRSRYFLFAMLSSTQFFSSTLIHTDYKYTAAGDFVAASLVSGLCLLLGFCDDTGYGTW